GRNSRRIEASEAPDRTSSSGDGGVSPPPRRILHGERAPERHFSRLPDQYTAWTGRRVPLRALAAHERPPPRQLSAVDQVAQAADAVQNRTLALPGAAGLWCCLVDAVRHAAERQRLEPDAPGAAQRREEDALTAEERGLDLADELDV